MEAKVIVLHWQVYNDSTGAGFFQFRTDRDIFFVILTSGHYRQKLSEGVKHISWLKTGYSTIHNVDFDGSI